MLATECGTRGKRFRSRVIIAEAKYGGLACPSNLNETKVCLKKCKGRPFKFIS